VDSEEAGDDSGAGVGDSKGVPDEALSATGKFSGLGDPSGCKGLVCGPASNVSGAAEETGRTIETSRF